MCVWATERIILLTTGILDGTPITTELEHFSDSLESGTPLADITTALRVGNECRNHIET